MIYNAFLTSSAAVACALACWATTPATAAPLHPTGLTVTTPAGSNDTTDPYRDDVMLRSLTFGGIDMMSSSQIAAISQFTVLSGRSRINAEWGDLDDTSDGDGTPFDKAGHSGADQETTDPTIQDATLRNAFNSLSLSEMSDGEGGGDFSFRTLFSRSIVDNQVGADDIPELVIFERGMNDAFDIRLILGGSFEAPETSQWLETSSRLFADTGIMVDTKEIGRAQSIGIGGFDLDAFGLDLGQRVYGMELRTRGGSGPDLNGFFLTAADASSFGDPLTPVPLPAGLWLLGSALAGCIGARSLCGKRPATA
ncbi:exosortase-dependent surface protein XDP2 [Roseobacter sp. A03A-229]